jgi:hypothetical protein
VRRAVDILSLPVTTLAFHDPVKGFRTAAKWIKGANGIAAEKPGNRLFVSAIVGGVSPYPYILIKGNKSIPTKRNRGS